MSISAYSIIGEGDKITIKRETKKQDLIEIQLPKKQGKKEDLIEIEVEEMEMNLKIIFMLEIYQLLLLQEL